MPVESLPEVSFHIEICTAHAVDELRDVAAKIEDAYAQHQYMPGVVDHIRSLANMVERIADHCRTMLRTPPAEPPAEYTELAPWQEDQHPADVVTTDTSEATHNRHQAEPGPLDLENIGPGRWNLRDTDATILFTGNLVECSYYATQIGRTIYPSELRMSE